MKVQDFEVREYWQDGSMTTYVGRGYTTDEALKIAKEKYDIVAHVWNQHGTPLTDRPVRFECDSISDRPWHPAMSISSLIETVYMLEELEAMTKGIKMIGINEAQSDKINSTSIYSIDYSDVEYSYKLEEQAEEIILDQTDFDRSEDLGGLLVYFKGDELVAFYDYEMQKGTVYA